MTLWSHQSEALQRMETLEGFGLFADMGTGKSRVVVEYHNRHHPERTLITTVASAVDVWRSEFEKHGTGQVVVLLTGTIKERVDTLRANLHHPGVVFVTNYEGVVYPALAAALKRVPWSLLVADEAHKLKSPSGKTSRFFGSLRASKRVALTGTPLADKPVDAWGLYRFIDRSVFPPTYAGFKARYVDEIRVPFPKVVGYRNLEDFAARFWSVSYRVKASDVLDLPEILPDQWRVVPLDDRSKAAYRDMKRQLMAEGVTAANSLVAVGKLHQIACGFLLDETGKVVSVSPARSEVLFDLLEPLLEPVVVFANYREDFARIQSVANRLGRRYGEVSGSRKDLGPGGTYPAGVDILAVHARSGGSGIDLTRARVAVYYSMGFSLQDFEQSRARVHRPGQTRAVQYAYLVAPGTIDEVIVRALAAKQDAVRAAMAGLTL